MPEFVGWIFHIKFCSVLSRPAVFLPLYFIISLGWLKKAAVQVSLELELLVTYLISSAETSQLNVLQNSSRFGSCVLLPCLFTCAVMYCFMDDFSCYGLEALTSLCLQFCTGKGVAAVSGCLQLMLFSWNTGNWNTERRRKTLYTCVFQSNKLFPLYMCSLCLTCHCRHLTAYWVQLSTVNLVMST